uniref:Uncharacterized protein n=1 Tax=Setaria digitata TaxID=48799 RepID=A0A915Q4A7_9BILA
MQILDDKCSKDERYRTTLLASSSSTSFHVPVTAVNMHPNRTTRRPHVQCHYIYNNDNGNNVDNDNPDNGENDDNDNDEDANKNDSDNGDKEKDRMEQNSNGFFFGSNYHYLQIDRNSINILLKVAAAFVLLCIAGCLVLQHLRISRLDYRIRRIELNSAYSIQIWSFALKFHYI